MFGMGGSEIIVILIVALIFLGPDKLPSAAKTISKGIRDIKKQSRSLQQQIESDEQIGGAIRDLKSALRGEPEPLARPRVKAKPELPAPETPSIAGAGPEPTEAGVESVHSADAADAQALDGAAAEPPVVRLPPVAGEADPDVPAEPGDDAELAAMIRPASGTVAKGS
jgi:sec-independent protein translocase protein TatB